MKADDLIEVMRLVPEGGDWRDLPPEISEAVMGGSYRSSGWPHILLPPPAPRSSGTHSRTEHYQSRRPPASSPTPTESNTETP